MSFSLELPDGSQLRIPPAGVLLGRNPDSDIVLTDAKASRVHALVYEAERSVKVVGLGRGETLVAGSPLTERGSSKGSAKGSVSKGGVAALSEGEALEVPGLRLTLRRMAPARHDVEPWVLKRVDIEDGGLYGVRRSPFTVGGGSDDDVFIEAWPERALVFRKVDDRVLLEARTDFTFDGRPLKEGQVEVCSAGCEIKRAAVGFKVIVASEFGGLQSTALDSGDNTARSSRSLPSRVKLTFLPRGARLYLPDLLPDAVYLPERRAELVALLLNPPAPNVAGDLIDDDVVLSRLWPRQAKVSNDIHVLVHRVRKTLAAAGLDGVALLQRDAPQAATRFVLRDDATVEVA